MVDHNKINQDVILIVNKFGKENVKQVEQLVLYISLVSA